MAVSAQSIRTRFSTTINVFNNYYRTQIDTFSLGDSVTVHAYYKKGNKYSFLIETNDYADIINCKFIPFDATEKQLKKLPNALSDEVLKLRLQLKNNIENRKQQLLEVKLEEEKLQYRAKALRGEIKAVLDYQIPRSIESIGESLQTGDTVTLIGYSKVGSMNYYAMYSDETVGTFSSSLSRGFTIKNEKEIDFEKLPAYDDQEVKLRLQQQSSIVDSVMTIKIAEAKERLVETQKLLIQTYKDNRPFVITDVSWNSNSVGLINVSINITNCTEQTIKYVTFSGYFKNAVGDKCQNEIGGGSVWKAKGVGPIGPCPTTLDNFEERIQECKGSYIFDNVSFYSRVAQTFLLTSVSIQYTNGKTITLSGANLDKHVRY